MNKVKLVRLAMVLTILALTGPALAQSVPANVSTPLVGLTMSHTINHSGQKLLPYLVVEHGKVKLSTDNRYWSFCEPIRAGNVGNHLREYPSYPCNHNDYHSEWRLFRIYREYACQGSRRRW